MPATRSHAAITTRLLIETVALLLASAWAAIAIAGQAAGTGAAAGAGDARWWWLYPPVLLLQALLFQRLYIIGREASHRSWCRPTRCATTCWGSS